MSKREPLDYYYEAENINMKLNKMNEVELESKYAQKLIDRLYVIRQLELHRHA